MNSNQNTTSVNVHGPISNRYALTAAGISPSTAAEFLKLLEAAVTLSNAQAAVLISAGQGLQDLLLSVRLSRSTIKNLVLQMQHWVIPADVPTSHILSLSPSAPLFVISTPLPMPTTGPSMAMSLLTTGESLPATFSLEKLEGVTACMAALLTNRGQDVVSKNWIEMKNDVEPLWRMGTATSKPAKSIW